MASPSHRFRPMPGVRSRFPSGFLTTAVLILLATFVACDAPGRSELPPPPSAEEVRSHYSYAGELEVEITGNVARVSITVDPEPFRQGGDLWLKGMPYLVLFSQGTKDAMDAYPGLGGVRVVALHPSGDAMAEALLSRGRMNDYAWREALNVAGQARRDASERPGRMRDLVQWGEDNTEFEYNSEYITSP